MSFMNNVIFFFDFPSSINKILNILDIRISNINIHFFNYFNLKNFLCYARIIK